MAYLTSEPTVHCLHCAVGGERCAVFSKVNSHVVACPLVAPAAAADDASKIARPSTTLRKL
eukprot:4354935-Prymnesium_polylepis.2